MRLRLSQLQDEQQQQQQQRGGASARNTRALRMSTPRTSNDPPLELEFAADGSLLPQVGSDFVTLLTASFRGDYLKLRHHAGLMHTLGAQAGMAPFASLAASGGVGRIGGGLRSSSLLGGSEDDPPLEEVVFSDYVTKFNRRNAGQARVVALTQSALYVLQGPKRLQLRRRFGLCDLAKVSLSRLCTDLIVLHHATEHGRSTRTQPPRNPQPAACSRQQQHRFLCSSRTHFAVSVACFVLFSCRSSVDLSKALRVAVPSAAPLPCQLVPPPWLDSLSSAPMRLVRTTLRARPRRTSARCTGARLAKLQNRQGIRTARTCQLITNKPQAPGPVLVHVAHAAGQGSLNEWEI